MTAFEPVTSSSSPDPFAWSEPPGACSHYKLLRSPSSSLIELDSLHQPDKMPPIKEWLNDKLVVTSEPGLSNTELMLTNKDLRPGETRLLTQLAVPK